MMNPFKLNDFFNCKNFKFALNFLHVLGNVFFYDGRETLTEILDEKQQNYPIVLCSSEKIY